MAVSSILLSLTYSTGLILLPALHQTDVEQTPDGPAVAVANIVTGILSYSRWPEQRNPVRLCIAGQSAITARITSRPLIGGRTMVVSRRPGNAVSVEDCDAIFLASVTAADQQRLLRAAAGRPLLTLNEAGNGCVPGVMFCIRPAARGGMTFDLDIDAVSRSRVRIDSRVLLLGRRAVTR